MISISSSTFNLLISSLDIEIVSSKQGHFLNIFGINDFSNFTNWNDRQLPKDGFHWENVKHLTVRLALIHDTGTAIQKPSCAKTTKIRIF